jgi:hypothetical protein
VHSSTLSIDGEVIGLNASAHDAGGDDAQASVGLSISTNLTAQVEHGSKFRLIGFLGASYMGLKAVRLSKQLQVGGGASASRVRASQRGLDDQCNNW